MNMDCAAVLVKQHVLLANTSWHVESMKSVRGTYQKTL